MDTCKPGAASKRYIRRVVILMLLYLAAVFSARWAFDNTGINGIGAWILAVLPALPIIGVFWAVMRLIVEEQDEFLRMLIVRQCLVATGFCLSIVTVWQWLQNFDLVGPGNAGFGAAFFWFIGLGAGALYNRVTMGTWGNVW